MNLIDSPWIPVKGHPDRSLRELFINAHTIDGLGAMSPLEHESMLRFLTSISAVILRGTDEGRLEDLDEARGRFFDLERINVFFDQHSDAFNLTGPKAFMQEWHLDEAAYEVGRGKAKPIALLDASEPGPTSVLWGIKSATTYERYATLALHLVGHWFHSKCNNGRPIPGLHSLKPIAGAPSGIGENDSTYFLLGSTLAETLLLNTFASWVESDKSLPAWLDQDATPPVGDPKSLFFSTWNPNRPVLYWDEGQPVGVIIACTKQPIPALDDDVKLAAKAVHQEDPFHIHELIKPKAKAGEEVKAPWLQRQVAPAHLESLEGVLNWHRQKLPGKTHDWMGENRLFNPGVVNGMRLGIYRESAGVKSRDFISTEWHEFNPNRLVHPDSDHSAHALLATTLVTELTKVFTESFHKASESGGAGGNIESARRRLFAALDPTLTPFLSLPESGEQYATDTFVALRGACIEAFTRETQQFVTPASMPGLMRARSKFAGNCRFVTAKSIKSLEEHHTPAELPEPVPSEPVQHAPLETP